MLPAFAHIVTCPFCGTKKELLALTSGNTIRAKHWSDQKMIAPMLPIVSPVQKCPTCGKYYLIDDQPFEEGNDYSTELGELSYQQWKEAYSQFQADKNTKRDDMQVIRHYLIMAFNDDYYRYFDKPAPAQEEAYFIDVIHEYIASNKWDSRNILFKAELYREAGEMDKCREVLSKIDPNKLDSFNSLIYKEMMERIVNNDKKVFEIDFESVIRRTIF